MSNPQTPLDVWATVPFSDASEMIAAMSDPRYKSPIYPNRFREAVERKVGISEGIGTDNVRDTTDTSLRSIGIGTGALTGESPAEIQTEPSREYAASRPDAPMAIRAEQKRVPTQEEAARAQFDAWRHAHPGE
jgi:hypothetical protein